MSRKELAALLWPGANGSVGSKYYTKITRKKSPAATIETCEDALNDLEEIIAHKPGDPGPGYDVITRAERVIKTLEARRRW